MIKVRLQAMCLTWLGIMSIITSCGGPSNQADALVTADGKVAGVVVRYQTAIDQNSISNDTYMVPGHKVASFFVSDSNPFRKDSGKDVEQGGRYVVLFVKDDSTMASGASVDLIPTDPNNVGARVKQVAPVKTVSGKTIKPWGKILKTTESFMSSGGQISK